MVDETNRYAHQNLSAFPDRLANFCAVTCAELKAFIAINIIMGMARLPNLALYWSCDEFFGNQGIKKTMTKNRFEEIGICTLVIQLMNPLEVLRIMIAFIQLDLYLIMSGVNAKGISSPLRIFP